MSRPRRTTEFYEDPPEEGNFGNRRQHRVQARTTGTPSTGLMHKTARFGQPLSLERDRSTLLGLPSSTSKSLGRKSAAVSSIPTPMRNRATPGDRHVALHSDKKWIQEQAQQIADYLYEMLPPSSVPGITPDFFSRSSGLRQMSLKQFVGVVNFFFQHIWPNRPPLVSANAIEDIMSALSKLNYPYQVNKSWLMTPTTQHSFGHVVVMLDFLKDFAPPPPSQQDCLLTEFPFIETTGHITISSSTLSTTKITVQQDEEINMHMFLYGADAFTLWDNNNMDECARMQRKTADMLVSKRCDLPNVEALDADIVKQQVLLEEYQQQISETAIDEKKQKHLNTLVLNLQKLQTQLKNLNADTKAKQIEVAKLQGKMHKLKKVIKDLSAQVNELKNQVAKQKCTLQQYEQLKLQSIELEHESEVYERQLHEFGERGFSQLAVLTHDKKLLLDKVERFNANLREFHFSGICSSSVLEPLELPLPPKQNDIKARFQPLQKICEQLTQNHAQVLGQRKKLEKTKNSLNANQTKLEAELKTLMGQTKVQKQLESRLEASIKTKRAMWVQHQLNLDESLRLVVAKCEQLERLCADQQSLLKSKEKDNNEFVTLAEQRHSRLMAARAAALDKYQDLLIQAEGELKMLNTAIEANNLQQDKARQQMAEAKTQSFTSDLRKLFNEN